MTKTMFCVFLGQCGLWSGLAVFSASAHANLLSELNADQQKQLLAGEQVYWTVDIDDKPWPKMVYYQLVKATPEETMAVGYDFESKPPYTPGLKESKIVKVENPSTVQVQYVLGIPVLGDETVLHRFHLSSYGTDAYLLDWKLIQGSRTKQSEGRMRVEAMPSGEAIIAFEGFVDPGIMFAGMFSGKALDQTLQQGAGFIQQVEKEHTEQPAVLKSEIAVLRKALQK